MSAPSVASTPVFVPAIRSVNAGALRASEHTSSSRGTAILKSPVDRIDVRVPHGSQRSGVCGDEIGDHRHHGGERQAVYAMAREELDHWQRELQRELPDGYFGENLTTVGLDVDHALVGEHWAVGTAVLVVRWPRIPCRTFAGHMGERGWVRRFTQHARSGAYLSVEQPGTIVTGDQVRLLQRPGHDITVEMLFRALSGDKAAARQIVASGALRPDEDQRLRRLL